MHLSIAAELPYDDLPIAASARLTHAALLLCKQNMKIIRTKTNAHQSCEVAKLQT
jgi:hypothetical protein